MGSWTCCPSPEPAAANVHIGRALVGLTLRVRGRRLSRAYTLAYWFRSADNFNSVVHGGVLLAALAVLDEPAGGDYGKWRPTPASFPDVSTRQALVDYPPAID